MKRGRPRALGRAGIPFMFAIVIALTITHATRVSAQVISERGFVEGRGQLFFQENKTDTPREIGDVLLRQEVFIKPSPWLRLFGGVDLRGNTHDQVEDEWRLDFQDRGTLRPRAAVRRLGATISAPHFTLDAGKQFIRWGRADILNPTDRFAPRDYLTVIENDFLPVLGARAAIQAGTETIEGVWVPRFTPSRIPLLSQRWTVLPPEAAGIRIIDNGALYPEGSQQGVRWNHVGQSFEMSASFYDGYSNLPNINILPIAPTTVEFFRTYPRLRSYGADVAIPTGIVTIKGETAWLKSPDATLNDYVLYVVELERQVGEWIFDGGYIGEVITTDRGTARFGPDEGVAKSIIGRVSYTLGPRRSLAAEGAVRQNADGAYGKGEFSQTFGQHIRVTVAGVVLGGDETSFLGQYKHNSNASIAVRFSY